MIIKTVRNKEIEKARKYLEHQKKSYRRLTNPKKQEKKPARYRSVEAAKKIHNMGDLLAAIFSPEFGKQEVELLK